MNNTSIYWLVLLGFISLVLLISTIYLFVTNASKQVYSCPKPCNTNCQPTPCPQPAPIQPNQPYTIMSLQGEYVQLCSGCLSGYQECFDAGLIVTPIDKGSKFTFQPLGGNVYQIKSSTSNYVLKAVNQSSSSKSLICSSSVVNCQNNFMIQTYYNTSLKTSLYQFQSMNGTYLGTTSQKEISTQHGIVTDGFKVTDPNTFFFIQ